MKQFRPAFLALILFLQCLLSPPALSEPLRGVVRDSAMVATVHPLASQVGVDILKNGGNAFDAAVAVQFALAVVFPAAGNIGGGGFAVLREKNGKVAALDFREKAPKAATRDMFLDEKGEFDNKKSLLGTLSSGVPGSVDGMFALHEKYGSLSMAKLIQPAIDLAEEGFSLTKNDARLLNRFEKPFKENNSWNLPTVKESPWKEGDIIRFKELANTLSIIRDLGKKGFYEGTVARLIAEDVQKGGGLISLNDLKSYKSSWREPVTGNYKGHRIITMPPPSSGGIALMQLLKGAEGFPLAMWGHNSRKSIHLMTELERRVYADRATYLGDPDFYDVPQEMLLSDAYNQKRFADISMKAKTASSAIKKGKVDVIESVETTHFSIVDAARNAIGITTTLNSYFGNKKMVKGAGFFLNNEMDDFSAKPGVPNQFGLVGAEANAIEPEKRMLSSMTPTIIEKGNRLFMVLGTPGGSTIITSVFQTILNVIDHHMSMQEAVNAKKFHHQWLPDVILMEKEGFDPKVIKGLSEMGHVIETKKNLGSMSCVLVLPDGNLEGGSDQRRGDNTSMGY